jgi:acetylornithine deacetylase/succinyl-diaminopimelate desuccinylase-like protein
MSDVVDRVLQHADDKLEQSLGRLFELLRIPSISAQPEHAADCARAAEWARAQLALLGLEANVHATAGSPVVLAHSPTRREARGANILFYGHYDVQPPEPLELWDNPPFEPRLIDGPRGKRIVARGAVDDKGQAMMFLEAMRAWKEVTGGVPANITVLLEGEEEVGSPNLEPFLVEHQDALRADFALISDTGMWNIDTPALTTRLRGLAYVEIKLRGAARDLHSGLFGGSALNAINVLTQILGELHDTNGGVTIPGFYNRVRAVSPEQTREWDALGFDESGFLNAIGLSAPSGEKGVPGLQRLWARPTADLNGIWGGYTGQGAKTVIAAEARAKLSCRLVPDQDPAEVVEGIKEFVNRRLPPGTHAEFQVFSASPQIEIPTTSAFVGAAQAILAEEYGRGAVLVGSGGSIPVVEALRRQLGLDTLLMGFGLDDDQTHSPNEKFELCCFHHGLRSHIRLLGRLAEAA